MRKRQRTSWQEKPEKTSQPIFMTSSCTSCVGLYALHTPPHRPCAPTVADIISLPIPSRISMRCGGTAVPWPGLTHLYQLGLYTRFARGYTTISVCSSTLFCFPRIIPRFVVWSIMVSRSSFDLQELFRHSPFSAVLLL